MISLTRLAATTFALTALVAPTFASAQTPPEDTDGYERNGAVNNSATGNTTMLGEGTPSRALPPPQSDEDPLPPVAAPAVSTGGITEQAGVGGTQAYGRAGVLELGGSLGFSRASDFTQLTIAPTVGWFFMDNFEISGIVGFNYINTDVSDSAYLTLLVEPSIHVPFTQTLFGFVGLGVGLSYAKDPGAGFALAPRLGMNVMVGRSGILTPSVQLVYSTSDAVQTQGGTLLAVSTSLGINVGYTVMW